MATSPIALFDGSIILNATEVAQGAENAAIADWVLTDEFIVCVTVAITVACNKASDATTFKLQYRKDGGSWTDVDTGNELIPGTGTDLVNGNSVTQRITTNVPAGCASGFANSGVEVEGTLSSNSVSMATETYTEIQFAVDPTNATAGSNYEFAIYNNAETAQLQNAALSVVLLADVTMLASANIDVTAGKDSLTFTGHNAGINVAVGVDAGIHQLSYTAHNPTVEILNNIDVTAGIVNLSYTEHNADINAAIEFPTTKQAFSFSGHNADINVAIGVDAGVGNFTITNYAPTLNVATGIAAGIEHLSYTNYAPDINLTISFTAGIGHLSYTAYGQTVLITEDVDVTAGIEHLSIAEHSPVVTLTENIDVTAGVEHLSIAGYSPGINAEIVFDAGIDHFTLTPYAQDVSINIGVETTTGNFSYTTYAADINPELDISAGIEHLSFAAYNQDISADIDVDQSLESLSYTAYNAIVGVSDNINVHAVNVPLSIVPHPATIELIGDLLSVTSGYSSYLSTEGDMYLVLGNRMITQV